MKREYRVADELGKQRSIGKFREFAKDGASVQLVLPLLEVMQLVQDGCGQLLREAGVRLMQLVMEEEAERLVGPRHQPDEQRRGYRWGNEAGYCVVDGQKVPIERIRLRSKDGRELPLGSYQLFQRSAPLEDGVWWKMMRGLTTRNYGAVTKTFRQAYGVEKSAVSERFVQASKEKLRELLERSLADLDLCAMLIDGTPVKGRQMIAVIGIDREGMKHVLGLREGATENATVVRELLEDLGQRGVDLTRVRLYVLDGAKALHTAVKKVAGASALIQRCQLHKKRNVRDHLPKQHQPGMSTDWQKYSTPEECRKRARDIGKDPQKYEVIQMSVERIRAIPSQRVEHIPIYNPNDSPPLLNRAHTDVFGEKDEEARLELFKLSQPAIPFGS